MRVVKWFFMKKDLLGQLNEFLSSPQIPQRTISEISETCLSRFCVPGYNVIFSERRPIQSFVTSLKQFQDITSSYPN